MLTVATVERHEAAVELQLHADAGVIRHRYESHEAGDDSRAQHHSQHAVVVEVSNYNLESVSIIRVYIGTIILKDTLMQTTQKIPLLFSGCLNLPRIAYMYLTTCSQTLFT